MICSMETMLKQLEGSRVVFVSGCFDLLHVGHVDLLKSAAVEGTALVVGLNSDSSVAQLKGHGRPIIPARERIVMLQSLRCVDWVVPFYEPTPLSLIAAINPDVMVKGIGATSVVENKFVRCLGGTVKFILGVYNKSTTQIISKITKGEM